MKAAVLYGNEDIRYDDWEEPVVRPGTVKVRIKATGICGSDVPRVLNNGAHYYPIVLGHEFCGEVTEIGEGVKNILVGDHVAGVPLIPCMKCPDCAVGNYSQCKHYSFIGSREQGSFADYVVLPEKNAVRLSPSISWEQGALFEPSTVCIHGIKISDYKGGKDVAVLGCGTIGLFTIQWARIFGAKTITAFARTKESLELAKKLGATHIINTKDEDFKEQAMAVTNGKGFDYVYEAAGSNFTHILAMEIAANKAHVCYIGTPKTDLTFTPRQWENLNRKELMVTGSWMSASAPFPGDEWTMTEHFFANGQLIYDPALFYKKYAMKDAKEAFMNYKTPGQVKGRILLLND